MVYANQPLSPSARMATLVVVVAALAALIIAGCDDPPSGEPKGPAGPVGPVGPADVEVSGDAILGSGVISSEARSAQGFDRVVLRGEGRVIVTQGSNESLTVETDDNLLQYIETQVRNGALEIKTRDGVDIAPTESVTYRVDIIELAALELLGAGSIKIDQPVAPELELVLGGAGDIQVFGIDGDDLTVELSGTGTIVVDGTVNHQDVKALGVGDYNAAHLESTSASVEARGSTTVTVWVTDTLAVTNADTASVAFYGQPEVTQQAGGLGTITPLGDR